MRSSARRKEVVIQSQQILMTRSVPREPTVSPNADVRRGVELGPALEFMRSLWRLNHALERMSCEMERALGVTAQQRMVLRCLGKRPGMTPSQLADLLHVDRSTISTALNRMQRERLLVRRVDESDRRSVTLWLSARGKRLDKPSAVTVESAVERLLAEAGSRDLRATERVMKSLSRQLDTALARSTKAANSSGSGTRTTRTTRVR